MEIGTTGLCLCISYSFYTWQGQASTRKGMIYYIRERAQKFRGVLFELFGAFWVFLGGGGGLFGTLCSCMKAGSSLFNEKPHL